MKHLSITALASLPLLCIGLLPSQAQQHVDSANPARGLAAIGQVYTGHSVDGNLQEALDQALQRAQQGFADSTGIQDAVFQWDLSGIRGTRGGFMGLQDLWVDVTVH